MKLKFAWRVISCISLTVILVGICLPVLFRESKRPLEEGVTIRFAHQILEDSVRDAFDAVAREFERRKAEEGMTVRIERIDVPQRAYMHWMRTQLVGGTAPEIMQVEPNGFEDGLLGRYFVSLTEVIEQENPYNKGSALDGEKWRNTILDGMHISGFNFRIVDYFGVPTSSISTRVFINADLLKSILDLPANTEVKAKLGEDLLPGTYGEFLALCEATRTYAEAEEVQLFPLVETGINGHRALMDILMGGLTQDLIYSEADFRKEKRIIASSQLLGYTTGKLKIDCASYKSGFTLMREVGQNMPPWFFQMSRDEVVFLYAQERTLMIAARSNDRAMLKSMIGDRFEQRVFEMPIPTRDTPGYGKHVLGPIYESLYSLTDNFGLIGNHPPEKQAIALEFLQFLTSLPGNQLFSNVSGRLPSVVGVTVNDELKPLIPSIEGYPQGPLPHANMPEFRRLMDRNYHLLFRPNGDVDNFLAQLQPQIKSSAIMELNRFIWNSKRNVARQDSLIAAHYWLKKNSDERSGSSFRKVNLLIDGQAMVEDEWLFYRDTLEPVRERLTGL